MIKEIESVKTTSENYWKTYVPANGYLLLNRDEVATIVGGRIIVPSIAKDGKNRYAATGVVIKKSPFLPSDYHDKYIYSIIQVGDRIGFNGSFPVGAPVKPNVIFENPNREQDRSCTLHCGDIISFLAETEEEEKELMARCLKASQLFYPNETTRFLGEPNG